MSEVNEILDRIEKEIIRIDTEIENDGLEEGEAWEEFLGWFSSYRWSILTQKTGR